MNPRPNVSLTTQIHFNADFAQLTLHENKIIKRNESIERIFCKLDSILLVLQLVQGGIDAGSQQSLHPVKKYRKSSVEEERKKYCFNTYTDHQMI